jgi:regulator of RNase E activity RraA
MAKGQDGFTPIGPRVDATGLDASALRLRTFVNGEVRQDTSGDELLFSPAQLVADLSRFVTLEPGDVILGGTPTGTGVVGVGDVVEVSLDGAGTVTSTIVEAPEPLRPYGAMPKATPAARAYATGGDTPRQHELSEDAKQILREVATATLTVRLAQHGVDRTFLTGLKPLRPDLRMVGYAHTLRYVAFRADVRDAGRGKEDAQKRAIESVQPEDVLIMEARGVESAGTIGDILAARVMMLGGAGIVTDGGVRDTPGVGGLDIPTYMRSAAAPSLWTAHVPLEIDRPITCAGALVMPDDVIVGDAEGVIVLPAALAERVAHESWEQEQRESWSMERVQQGESIRGVYPISPERESEYQRWLSNRPADEG